MTKEYLKNEGFTLVEMSIVLIIIGLLIGGVLKGQELLVNAGIKSTMSQVKNYQAATNTFYDTYGNYPGDISGALYKIPACAQLPTCAGAGGNANGIIGNVLTDWSSQDQPAWNSEATQFWIHLKLADLIDGISGQNIEEWGDLYPIAKMGGGFQIFYANETGTNQAQGHYFYLRNKTSGSHENPQGRPYNPAIIPRVDRDFDDGYPNTGQIISDDNYGECAAGNPLRYITSKEPNCLAAFKFQ